MRKFLFAFLAVLALAAMPMVAQATATLLVGNNNVEATDDYVNNGHVVAFPYVAAASGTADKAHVYFTTGTGTGCTMQDNGTAQISYRIGIYSDNSGHPGTLLSSATIFNPDYNAWWHTNSGQFGTSISASTTYWIAILVPDDEDSQVQFCFRDHYTADNPAGDEHVTDGIFTSLPSTWPASYTTWGDFSAMSAYIETAP